MKKTLRKTKTAGSALLAAAMLAGLYTGSVQAADTDDMYTVRYAWLATAPADLKAVEAAANEYLAEKAGIQVELYPLSYSNYAEQINLMITGGEKLDVITELSTTFTSDVAMNKLVPLDDLLEEYGQDAMGYLGEYIEACRVNGEVFAMPTIRDMAASQGVLLKTEALEAAGIDPASVTTIEQVDEVFAKLKEGRDSALIVPQTISTTIYENIFMNYDALGDTIGVLMNYGQDDLEVVNLFETEEYEKNIRKIREWYEKGYILSDVATNTDDGATLMSADKILGITNMLKPGVESQVSANMGGVDMTMIETSEPICSTYNVQSVGMAIPITCGDDEAAMKFLNLLYSDPVLINLLDFGIEGTHYVKTDVDNVITFPEGKDMSNSGYAMFDGWQRGNQLLSYVWEGDDPDLYEQLDAFNKSALRSKAFGFVFDASAVKTETAAIANVTAQYRAALENGTLDIDENLPKFQAALKEAGIDRVIEEKQAQLDAWAAENLE